MEYHTDKEITQNYINLLVEKIKFESSGFCNVYLRNGEIFRHNIGFEMPFNSQFEIPISSDGKCLFLPSWERGVFAFSTMTGEKIWQFKKSGIIRVLLSSHCLLALRYGKELIKLDPYTGEVIQILKSGTLEHIFKIDSRCLFLDRFRGKYSIIDVDTWKPIRSYPNNIVNPHNCLTCCIRKVYLQGNQLCIEGFEEYPEQNYACPGTVTFCRIIDSDFSKLAQTYY